MPTHSITGCFRAKPNVSRSANTMHRLWVGARPFTSRSIGDLREVETGELSVVGLRALVVCARGLFGSAVGAKANNRAVHSYGRLPSLPVSCHPTVARGVIAVLAPVSQVLSHGCDAQVRPPVIKNVTVDVVD